ncbi:WD40 repeat-like protein [Rozella allomycis CSF55]|uniref:WD40 repeat-like protein n=1 Tax=Rozella allomycis (strain CSF55) TaxID=988480 RepID=A0A075AW47_ROZAC|nr:hypothetical protein O9G_000829 [Rozella allomycis CSF55]RKP19793.1 WD40 repeat-like protein [Rozella allomycis CSF55]|eukprot:EPZ32754.1 hypothetical protein O9G_000829 [Rozella allomycis CSF55]
MAKLPWTEQSKPKEYRGHKSKVHSVSWSCDGKKLASGSTDSTARVWHVEKQHHGRDFVELRGHTQAVEQVAFHPSDADLLATTSSDKTVRIWDTKSLKCLREVSTLGENINLCWHPNGQMIAVGNKDDIVVFIDAESMEIIKSMQFSFEVNEVTWNSKGDKFFITTGLGTVQILSYPELNVVYTINAHTSNCYCLKFDPKHRYLAVGSADALASLWELDTLTCLKTFTEMEWPIRCLSFSHDGEFLAMASEDSHILICNTETGKQVFKVPSNSATNSIAWHPNKYQLAYACDDNDRSRSDYGIYVFGQL